MVQTINKKSFIFIIIILISTIIIPIVHALQTQSLTSVSWEDLPDNIEELTNYSLDIDFDFTSSSLQNYTIETSGVTILNIDNPAGCSINQNNITCPTNSEPSIAVQTNAIDNNSTISWIVYTNEATDGEEVWNLNFSITNTIDAPKIINQTMLPYNIQQINDTIELNISLAESNYSIQNATLWYQNTNSAIDNSKNTNIQLLALPFICDTTLNYCFTTIKPADLMNFSLEKYFFHSFIQIYDTVGNQQNDSSINFYVDNQNPIVTLDLPKNNDKFNLDMLSFAANISDNSLQIPVEYSPKFNCTLNINDLFFVENTTTIASINYRFNISTFSEGTYNWSVTCIDKAENSGISSTNFFNIDRSSPNITIQDNSNIASSSFTISTTANN